jgi:hypothetical protein
MSAAARTKLALPNFLVIGAMKAGTTSLFHYLRAHPQVFMSPVKELDFFDEGGNWRRGIDWYKRQFKGAGPGSVAVGEASTAYSKYPLVAGVPQRIATFLPNARFVYVVRDPIERIRSHYDHRVAIGAEILPLGEAVLSNPVYLLCSCYASQVEQYLDHYPPDRLLLVKSEDLRERRSATMSRVYAFLGVDESYVPDELEHEYYKTSRRIVHRRSTWSLRKTLKKRFPATKRAKELVDEVLPRAFHRLNRGRPAMSPGKGERIALDDRVRAQLAGHLEDDVERLRAYMPPGFDGWGIA